MKPVEVVLGIVAVDQLSVLNLCRLLTEVIATPVASHAPVMRLFDMMSLFQ